MDLQKEREAFEKWAFQASEGWASFVKSHGDNYENDKLQFAWKAWQAAAAKAQVKEVAPRQGGYYIRDLRNQPGNCMKFWYRAGYGTKHKNFFWCATLEEAKKYMGDCGWFEIWHAPYIDSLVEYTVDFQLADRGVGLVDLRAREQSHD